MKINASTPVDQEIELVIKIDKNVFTRLFDNGIEDYEIANDDLLAIAKSIRKGTPLPESCEDKNCISRQAVLNILKNNRYSFNISQEGYCEGKVLWREDLIKDNARKEIVQLPSVIPKEKTGHWIFKNDNIAIPTGYYQCSECEEGKVLNKYNFCPNCGVKMEER